MSVFIVSESTNKLITVLLVKALDFEENPGNEFNTFQVYNPEEKYPELHKLLKEYKEAGNAFQFFADDLSQWNRGSYGLRYAHNDEAMEDLKRENELPTIDPFDHRWYMDFARTPQIQVHKSLCCYLYQIEQNDSAIMNELRTIQVEYGNWLIEKTPEWNQAKWQ